MKKHKILTNKTETFLKQIRKTIKKQKHEQNTR